MTNPDNPPTLSLQNLGALGVWGHNQGNRASPRTFVPRMCPQCPQAPPGFLALKGVLRTKHALIAFDLTAISSPSEEQPNTIDTAMESVQTGRGKHLNGS
jgi:hypothetical protein